MKIEGDVGVVSRVLKIMSKILRWDIIVLGMAPTETGFHAKCRFQR